MPLLDDPWIDPEFPAYQRAAEVRVYRFDGESAFAEMPNVECLSVSHAEGTDPGSATFRYNLASGLDGAPASIQDALGTGSAGPYVLQSDDWLVVRATRPDGVEENLFSGRARVFGMGLDPGTEEVQIGATGIARHAWDDVIGGAIYRRGDDPTIVKNVGTDIPDRFNPDGKPNCIPDGYMAGSQSNGNDFRFPSFLDANIVRDPDVRTYWTLPKAARYILFNANRDQEYILNPDGQSLDDLLVSPGEKGDQSGPIYCPDTPITGRDWPSTLYRLIAEVGFGMAFRLDSVGDPLTRLHLFANQEGPVKKLYLAPRGTRFDPTLFNFDGSSLHRDIGDVVNHVTVKGHLHRWEASLVLAPGFPASTADSASATALAAYDRNDEDFKSDNEDKYRLYIYDETGEGNYRNGTATETTTPTSLDDILGENKYAKRRRPPLGKLLTRDEKGLPRDATLWISTDYAGPYPGIWDGSGTWQEVTTSSWRILGDRIGIEVTDSNPNTWEIGPSKESGAPFPAGVVRGVEAMSKSGGTRFFLRLTCVIEGDIALTSVAGPREGGVIPYSIRRVIDASDRYFWDRVKAKSEFGDDETDKTITDHRQAALREAQSIRAGTESGVLSGAVSIPRLTTYYRIGDRIGEIEGRGLGLRTDQGTDRPVYPVVVGVSYTFTGGRQGTTLEVADAGTLRAIHKRAPLRKAEVAIGGGGGVPEYRPGGGGTPGPVKDYTTDRRFAPESPAKGGP